MTNCPVFVERKVAIIGAPLSFGQSLQGVDLAPQSLRQNGLIKILEKLSWQVEDRGDLKFRHKMTSDATRDANGLMLNGNTTTPDPPKKCMRDVPSQEYTETEIPRCLLLGEACGQICHATSEAAKQKNFVLTLGGDHSIAAGSIAG